MDSKSYDVIVIGGGAAGMMSAISVKKNHPEYTVAIIDRTFELGRKLLISGAGRGNLTNRQLINGPSGFFHGDKQYITSVFSQFGFDDIIRFFDELGVPTYEEKKTDRGKIFPVIDHVKTVRNIFIDRLQENHVEIICDTTVSDITNNSGRWNVTTTTGVYSGKFIILAAGGQTYPSLGSDGSGYDIARRLGHTIIAPVVSAVPIVSKNMLSQYLQGEKMVMKVTLFIEGKEMMSSTGDVMFTKYGFSGPAILDISHDVSVHINREQKGNVFIELSFFPDMDKEEVKKMVETRVEKHLGLPVSHVLWGILTEKSAGAVCSLAEIAKDTRCSHITNKNIERLVGILTAYRVEVIGTRGWNEAEFTAGGIDTSEIDAVTLESKKAKGIYIVGEMGNVDGQVGGFNLSWAWASGWVAGKLQ